MRKQCPHRGYIMVQQYMASLEGVIISNGIISKVPSATVTDIITCSGTHKRTNSTH